MSNRPSPLTREQQADLGQTVVHLRAAGACWKRIEAEFGMSRRQLWRCVMQLRMSQQKPGMSHREDCAAA